MSEPLLSDAELDRRVLARVFPIACAFLALAGFVNASTLIADAAREGRVLDPHTPWVLEFTSVAVIAALVPAMALYERRFPLDPKTWPKALLAHVVGSLAFCALHMAGMILLRQAAYGILLGKGYRPSIEPLAFMAYEYRKDILTYATILLVLTLVRGVETVRLKRLLTQAEMSRAGRLTLKSGGRTILLDAASMEWARAAANYVDIRANGTTHLVRISLATLHEQLSAAGVDVVRVHRSWIVNRAKVVEIAPSGDGDFRIRTSDGSELRGSRRYRHFLQDREQDEAGR